MYNYEPPEFEDSNSKDVKVISEDHMDTFFGHSLYCVGTISTLEIDHSCISYWGGGGGGVATQKKTERYRKFQIWDWFFSVFFGFSILANFDWFNGFLLSGSFC